MLWNYLERRINEVETGITQRDQFLNEELNLADTLVREAVQNSLDAVDVGPVSVRFRLLSKSDGLDSEYLLRLLEDHWEHAEAAGLDVEAARSREPSVLVIEDYGTTGLTGNPHSWGDGSFQDFWRRHGLSHKSGTSRGRHGLGKLVFSCASGVGAFFGATLRRGELHPHLMGQCVLNLHDLDGKRYLPHGFYSDVLKDGPTAGLQVPVLDQAAVRQFCDTMGIRQEPRPGLSIVIPFPLPSLSMQQMTAIGIINYFFPILTGQLVLRFGDEILDADSLRSMAESHAGGHIRDADDLFTFIGNVSRLLDRDLPTLPIGSCWQSNGRLTADDFPEGLLEQVREEFERGRTVGLRLPVQISHKERGRERSFIQLFVQRPGNLRRGQDFYVRSGLTLPGEAKFAPGGRNAFGALVAEDRPVASFLGDAENASHSRWNGNSEKLRNYRSAAKTLRAIRNSLVQFHDLLARAVEERDDSALKDVLWTPGSEGPGARGKIAGEKGATPGGQTDPKPPPVSPPKARRQLFAIEKAEGGFTLLPKDVTMADLPIGVRIEAAFDRIREDPFRRHDPADFDFTRRGDVALTIRNIETRKVTANSIRLSITDPDFTFTATGFDVHRDLVVRLRTEPLEPME
ncbi:hypothetical protein [Imhoffiella purpurea]|uniref:Uncharacterized protein n=1 Tax=Imhoffiella purpurea TaxID=1249627 RepID=W9VC18_9GAMM|nr:hypothetical protein [Imhoffiella purpurea]EXJ13582.1 hypothetical protein D779_3585 [Imhoffiella purpurea]